MHTPYGRHELLVLPDVVEVILLDGNGIQLLFPKQASHNRDHHLRPPRLISLTAERFHAVVDQVRAFEVRHAHFPETGVDGEDVTFPDHTA